MEQRKSITQSGKLKFGASLHLGTYWNIPVKVHWTFGLLLLFILYTCYVNEFKIWQIVGFILTIFVLFFCVVLHEYGHALTARRYGIQTKDIVLSPIGGVARLLSIPSKPLDEFFIAIAGPLVNIILGGILALLLYLFTGSVFSTGNEFIFDDPIEFIRFITLMNFGLFIFNLIPAFPMDGGRILRALLSLKLGKVQATRIASLLGKAFAILFIVIGIFFQQITLALIGLFIFMMAGKEYDETRMATLLNSSKVKDLMKVNYSIIYQDDIFKKLIQIYELGKEKNYLVFDEINNIVGAVPELFIKDVIKNNDFNKRIGNLMSPHFVVLDGNNSLKYAIEMMRDNGISIIGVTINDTLVGVLDRNTITNYLRENAS